MFSFSSTDDGSFTLIDNQKQPKFRQRKFTNQYNNRVPRNTTGQTTQNRNSKQTTAARQNQTRAGGKKWKQTQTRSYYRVHIFHNFFFFFSSLLAISIKNQS